MTLDQQEDPMQRKSFASDDVSQTGKCECGCNYPDHFREPQQRNDIHGDGAEKHPVQDAGKSDKTPRITPYKNDAEAVADIIKQTRKEFMDEITDPRKMSTQKSPQWMKDSCAPACDCYKATRLHHLPDCPAYVPKPQTPPTSTEELSYDDLCRLSMVFCAGAELRRNLMPYGPGDARIHEWLKKQIAGARTSRAGTP